MFSKLNQWLDDLKKKRAEARYNAGVDYANAQIALGEKGMEEAMNHVDMSKSMGAFDEFDRGVFNTILDHRRALRKAGLIPSYPS